VLELALVGADSAVLPESAAGWVVDATDPTCDETGAAVASSADCVASDVAICWIAFAVSVMSRRTISRETPAVACVELDVAAVSRVG
jgi:hypothetical protein